MNDPTVNDSGYHNQPVCNDAGVIPTAQSEAVQLERQAALSRREPTPEPDREPDTQDDIK